MKSILKLTIVLVVAVSLTSCWTDKTQRNVQYMPDVDMYESVGYETYTVNPNFADGRTSQKPVEGTIARGKVPYDFDGSLEGYEAAKANSTNPLERNEANMENGEAMYNIYCASCHGKTGAGDGTLVQRDKFLGVPNYKDRDITEGSIHHVIMYGKGIMGSHAAQLTAKERWQVTMYVDQLRAELLK